MTIPKYCILCENYKQHPCRCTHCEDFDEFIVSESGKHLILTMNKQYEQEKIKELEQIKVEILEHHCIKCYGTCETYCPYSDCIEPKDVIEDLHIIDNHIEELKGEKE